MCFNIVFIPLIYFFFPETNGWKLETLDAIFAEAHEKHENPVFTEKRWRKSGWKKRSDSVQANQAAAAKARGSILSATGSDDTKIAEERGNTNGKTQHLEEKVV